MTTLFESSRRDLLHAARQLAKAPAFTLIAVFSLALGIGANTAIFSMISALILKPLPVERPKELVTVGDPTMIGAMSNGAVRTDLFSYPLYRELRAQNQTLSGLLASGRTGRLAVILPGTDTEVSRVQGRIVSGNYFEVLGVPAFRGRTLTPADEGAPGASPVVVVGHQFWREKLGGDPAVLGRSISINTTPFSIVGIAPPEFGGEVVGQRTDLFIPITMQASIHLGRPNLDQWESAWLQLIGRLKPGKTSREVRAEMNGIYGRVLAAEQGRGITDDNINERTERPIEVAAGSTGLSRVRARFSRSLFTLFAIVGLVLLVACANVANLLLERATGRRKEIGVRLALGAGRGRLVRQLLTESLLLGLLGATLGLVVSWAAGKGFLTLVGGAIDFRPNAVVLGFTALLAVLTALLFGLFPSLTATRVALAPTLQESGRSIAGGSRAQQLFGRLLVISQFAFSLLLLVGAGLFVRTLQNLQSLDLGVDREQLLMLNVDPVAGGISEEGLQAFTTSLLDHLKTLPNVQGVTASENGIFSGTESGTGVRIEGYQTADGQDEPVLYDTVAPDYFAVNGIDLSSGRGLLASDRRGAPGAAVVNQAFVSRYFEGRDPHGRQIVVSGPPDVAFEIVGVSRDVRDHDLRGEIPPRLYVPMLQVARFPSQLNIEIRSDNPAKLVEPVRKAMRTLYPAVPIDNLTPLDRQIAESALDDDQMIASLSSVFGALALILAAIGLYGVVSFGVARRTHEIGVRLALGADRQKVLGLVLKETLALALAGIVIGLPLTLFALRGFEARFAGLSSADPLTIAVAMGILIVIATLAGTAPSLRALRIEPTRALREN